MSRSPLLVTGTCLSWLVSTLHARPIALETSELFLYHGGELRQAVLAVIKPEPGATLTVVDGTRRQTFDVEQLPQFMNRLVIPLPPARQTRQVQVELAGTGRQGTVELQPARRWTVFIVPHTHLDIGYTDLQERVWTALATNLDDVIELSHKTADWPEGSRFHWTIEGTALFENFARRFGQDRVDALVDLIRAGRVELTAVCANLLTELCGPESLLRAAYAGRRLSERYGIRIDTAMINDVPGYTWALPQIWSQLGVRYANLRANGIRGKFVWHRPGAVPRPFRWRSPDGSQVVCWYTDSYREANFLRQGFPEEPGAADIPALQRMLYQNLTGHLRRAGQTGYDRDVIQLRMGGDNLTAVESVCRWVRYWNERWTYPRLRIATSRQFFHALENDSRPIPVFSGDVPDWWADGAASSARQTGDARITHDQAVALEALSSLPDGPAREPESDTFSDIHAHLLLYAEHTWGASGGWYSKDPSNVEQQWAVKRGYVEHAGIQTADARQRWTQAVAGWARPATNSVIVWNTLSWPRSGPVELNNAELPSEFVLRDASGQSVPIQKCGEANWCFVARDVPPLGYALYEIQENAAGDFQRREPVYEIEFDARRGVVRQIRHRPTGRRLTEASPRFAFNQYVCESGGKREKIMPSQLDKPRSPADKTVSVCEPAQLTAHIQGPVFDRIVTRTSAPNAPVIEQSYTTYAELDRVHITNRVEKIATQDAEGIYFAFPFNVPSPQCRLEIPFASMRPGADQLRYSAADFYSVYHWVEFWNKTGGVLWASIEAPVVVFGDLWPECWHDQTRIDNPLLLSYVMTNYWHTNYRRQQGGELTFRYAIRACDGGLDKVGAFRFGCEVGTPLVAQVVRGRGGTMPKTRSWFSVEPDNVMLAALKRAEDGAGWIIRLVELGVGDCTARLTLPPGRWAAVATDPTERGRRPVPVTQEEDRWVAKVAMYRSRIATLRLEEVSPHD